MSTPNVIPLTAGKIGETAARIKEANQQGQLLTLAQVSSRLQVSRTTTWRLVNERGMRCVRIGSSVRVREADLAAWLEKHTTGNGDSESSA